MMPLHRTLTTILLELDLWYAEGVQEHLKNSEHNEVGESLSLPISDYRDAVEDFKKGGPMTRAGKELVLKSLEQDRKYTKKLCERLQKESAVNPLLLGPASFFANAISEDIQKGIDEIKNLPERD